ncbi:hypothetical protein [Guptibacillus hwajinpoensis]|uniref:hypothetical protein n=1 Tax=Guptibacillus hwajinpoensis TaxID=208199 RepID=UPI003D6BF1A1
MKAELIRAMMDLQALRQLHPGNVMANQQLSAFSFTDMLEEALTNQSSEQEIQPAPAGMSSMNIYNENTFAPIVQPQSASYSSSSLEIDGYIEELSE